LLSNGGAGGYRAVGSLGIGDEMARASFDMKHALVFSGNYDLPFGKGKKFLSGMNSIGNAFLGGWSTNWIYSYYTFGQWRGLQRHCQFLSIQSGSAVSL
jgi:hypothetical protein